MVWDGGNASSGFSTGRPWLPIKEPQAARHAAGQVGDPDSVLETYRTLLGLRKENTALRTGDTVFFDTAEPVLAFARGGEFLCVFNLSPEIVEVKVTGAGMAAFEQGVERDGERMKLHANGVAILAIEGEAAVSDV